MKKLKKLELRKEIISSLGKDEQSDLKGGFSGGCSDGCLSAITHTNLWNCSNANCTVDCGYCGDPTWTGSANCF
uniref:class I lanthipeptide n=1 Tax=uncultured Dysgonomonas sp. TaxID=206096 RepID=UPI00260EB300|nr:class I lanthipeptide [uncultured Dysgonomonas sp.]